jgi:uncharacterized protein YndB with AHSA1/START domain
MAATQRDSIEKTKGGNNMSEIRQVKPSIVVETTSELAFEAVTQASELRDWFSDQAWTEARPGGRYAAHWNQGYHVEGTFTALQPPQHAAITWQGSGEPGETAVEFTIKAAAGGVEVTVVHSGFGPGKEWDEAFAQSEKGWSVGLENLKSTLETGTDLRLTRQPFLGIYLEPLTPERAAKEDIAAEQGIYVNGTVEGSGARLAGIVQGDVIVALNDAQIPGIEDLGAALGAHQVGDTVAVELVRGQARETVQVTLGTRPMEEVPGSAKELADLLAGRYDEANAELKAAVEGVTEEEAAQVPAEGEWSIKQTLAHLTVCERDYQTLLANVALDGWLDGGQSNPTAMPARLTAAMAITPTVQGLLDRFLADTAETVALVRALPEETVAHKARLFRIGQMILGLPDHTREHTEQIQRVLGTIRGE